jgi:cytochrome P450
MTTYAQGPEIVDTTAERIPEDIAVLLTDPKAYAAQKPVLDAYRWLRANNPFGVAEPPGYSPFFVATKHEDIQAICRANTLFHNADRISILVDKAAEAASLAQPRVLRPINGMDEPDHMKYRLLTQAWFTPQNVRKREAAVRKIARAAVDKMLATGGECDFVAEVALRYPLRVIMEILGVPEADEPLMLALTQQLFGSEDADLKREPTPGMTRAEEHAQIYRDFFTYFSQLAAARRAEPRDDVASVIANAVIDGKPIDDFETMSYYVVIATAGHDTTSSSTAGALQALCEFPEEFAKVKANPALIPGLVDEAVRWTTPVQHFLRTATADTEIRGRHVPKGSWVMLCYASGNRDEAVFEAPDRFLCDRRDNKQVSFGYGVHLCLGMHLAKMEMRVLFEELLPRLKTLELAGPPRRSEATFIGGPKALPIRFTTN